MGKEIFLLILVLIVFSGCSQPTGNVTATQTVSSTLNAQKVSLRALNTGFYDKQEIRVKAGTPVEFSFSADIDSGCGRDLRIPDFGVQLLSLKGETQTAIFTPKKGVYEYHCGMRMFRGKLIAE